MQGSTVVLMKLTWLLAAVAAAAQTAAPAAPAQAAPPDRAAIAISAPAQVPAPATESPTPAADSSARSLRISAGDLLSVQVYEVDELRRDVRVNGGGEISLPLVGSIRVQGLTSEGAEKAVAEKLIAGGFVKNPQVSVLIREFATQGVSVMGEVNKPGIYPVLGPRRLFDLISAASGMTPKAGRMVRVIRRDEPNKPIEVSLSGDPARSTDSNVEIYPGDTIVVSKAGIVYVVGDVNKPGGFVMDQNEHLTVFQAIALAEGAKTTASLKSAKLVRRGPSGVQEFPLQLNRIFELKAPDMPLQADDIIYVPTSTGKRAARKGLETIIQTVSGVLIYHP